MAKNLRAGLQQSIKASGKAGVTGGGIFSLAPLDLRFALQKTLDPRITFTRASTGTYVGSDGVLRLATTNEARFDHNPTTGESLGLLVEEARTNIAWPSTDYSGANYSKTNIQISASTTTAPDGSTCFAYEGSSASSLLKRLRFNFTTTTVGTYTWSIYIKPGTEDSCAIIFNDNTGTNGGNATILLTNGTVTSGPNNVGANTGTAVAVQALSNGFYKISLTSTFVSALTQIQAIIAWDTVGVSTTTGTLFPWGAQLEAGAFPTSYIPTTSATATRAADVASITGSNFSSWYKQNDGTFYASVNSLNFDTNIRGLLGLDTNTFARGYAVGSLFSTNNRVRTLRRDATNNINVSDTILSTPLARVATVFNSDQSVVSVNASIAASNSTVLTLSAMSDLRIGWQNVSGSPATNYLCGCISRLTYWPVRLPDLTLQSITQP
jgi:hypothetical protein